METQSRWRSKAAWAGIAALIAFVAKTWIGFEIPGWDEFINIVFTILIAFDLFNDPKNKTGY